MAVTMVSWNIAKRREPWRQLLEMGADIALLQEAGRVPCDVAEYVDAGPKAFWDPSLRNDRWHGGRLTTLYDRWTMVVKLSDRVDVKWLEPVPIAAASSGDFTVSQPGSIAAAIVCGPEVRPFVVASICAAYEKPHRSTGKMSWDIVDASVHRIISDLSLLIGKQYGHRIIAGGDLTVRYGYGENEYWKRRNATVFDRMDAIGLPLVGPQYPHGRQADPWPTWLPKDSLNVPTYCNIGASPAEANGQLDYVFASRGMEASTHVRALNEVKEWGASDHCRLLINVGNE